MFAPIAQLPTTPHERSSSAQSTGQICEQVTSSRTALALRRPRRLLSASTRTSFCAAEERPLSTPTRCEVPDDARRHWTSLKAQPVASTVSGVPRPPLHVVSPSSPVPSLASASLASVPPLYLAPEDAGEIVGASSQPDNEDDNPERDSDVHTLCRAGELDEALAAFERSARAGHASSRQLAKLVSSFSKAGRVKDAEALFERARAGEAGFPPVDDFVYPALLGALLRARDYGAAEARLADMLELFAGRMTPPLYTVSTSACRAFAAVRGEESDHWIGVAEGFLEAACADGCLDFRVAYPLLAAYRRAGRMEDASRLVRRCAGMCVELGPRQRAVRELLELCAAGWADEARHFFEGLAERGGVASEPAVLPALLSALMAAGRVSEAERLFQCALAGETGYPPAQESAWVALMSGLLRNKQAEKASAWVRRMLAAYQGRMEPGLYSVAVATYRDLALHPYSSEVAGHWMGKAEALVEKAAEEIDRSRLSAVFQPLMDGYARLGRMGSAERLLRRCSALGVPVDPPVLASLISACADREEPDFAAGLHFLDMMEGFGIPANDFVHGAFLKLALKSLPEALVHFAEELAAGGLPASAHGVAELFRRRMAAAGQPLNHVCFGLVVQHFCSVGDEAGALEWVARARAAGKACSEVYGPLLELAYRTSPEPARAADRYLAMMRADGVRPELSQACQLFQCYGRGGEAERAEELVRALLDGSERRALDAQALSQVFDHYGMMRGFRGREGVERVLAECLAGRHGGPGLLNVNVLCSVVEALGRCGDADAGLRHVLLTMPALGLRPIPKLLTTCFQGFASNGRLLDGMLAVRAVVEADAALHPTRPMRVADDEWAMLGSRVLKWRDRDEQRRAAALLLSIVPPTAGEAVTGPMRAIVAGRSRWAARAGGGGGGGGGGAGPRRRAAR